jgi:phosphohistidine phosphatase
MDLILWRHAHAADLADGGSDHDRSLTPRGRKQAARMARWLDRRLPDGTRVLCSPARRAEQTVAALGRPYRLHAELGPEHAASDLLAAVDWPDARLPTLVVGHQPTLGQVLALLLGMQAGDCSVRKGAVWWLRSRIREGARQTVLVTVQDPDLL